MKIKDHPRTGAEKEAKIKDVATFFPETRIHERSQKLAFSPFEKAVMERIFPETAKISKGDIPYPAVVRVSLSYRCNHNCSGCLCGGDHKRENALMDSNCFSKLFDALHSLRVKSIDLSGGGEPTLHPQFYQFAQMCIKRKFELSLLTNGVSLDSKLIDLVVESFSFLRVNLDASNDEVYNRIHHPPTPREFQKVLGNLERVVSERKRRESNLMVGAKVRMCQTNMNFIEEITGLVKDVGLDYIQFRINHKAFDSLLSEQEREVNKLIKELENRYLPFEVYGEVETGMFRRGCWLSPIHLIINPAGDAYPCSHFGHRPDITSFGNVFTRPADRLWFGSEHKRAVNYLKENDCPFKDCRWRIYNDFMRLPAGK